MSLSVSSVLGSTASSKCYRRWSTQTRLRNLHHLGASCAAEWMWTPCAPSRRRRAATGGHVTSTLVGAGLFSSESFYFFSRISIHLEVASSSPAGGGFGGSKQIVFFSRAALILLLFFSFASIRQVNRLEQFSIFFFRNRRSFAGFARYDGARFLLLRISRFVVWQIRLFFQLFSQLFSIETRYKQFNVFRAHSREV